MGIGSYLRETKAEMRHVSWPTRKQTISFTALVIVSSLLVAVLLGAFDFVFDYVLKEFLLDAAPVSAPLNTGTGIDGNALSSEIVDSLEDSGAVTETEDITPETAN